MQSALQVCSGSGSVSFTILSMYVLNYTNFLSSGRDGKEKVTSSGEYG
jgi:hypothetical protein